jgi:ribosomal protein L24
MFKEDDNVIIKNGSYKGTIGKINAMGEQLCSIKTDDGSLCILIKNIEKYYTSIICKRLISASKGR